MKNVLFNHPLPLSGTWEKNNVTCSYIAMKTLAGLEDHLSKINERLDNLEQRSGKYSVR
jgi:hypothetical protein